MQTPDSPKLSARLAEWYPALHAEGKFSGETYKSYVADVLDFAPPRLTRTVLDYGCGPKGGLAAESHYELVRAYDPYVPGYAAYPWDRRYDLVFSADVLEHMTVDQAGSFLLCVRENAPGSVFLVVATRPAAKTFPNGDNVHLTIEPADWWRGFLQASLSVYRPVLARSDEFSGTATFGFRLRAF